MKTDISMMNPEQQKAILESIDSNVVLLAGAGSGKTATLVKRTEYLINDMNVHPSNITIVTFTNKASKEIVERVAKITPDAYKMLIGTFHSICTRIIRKHGHHLGIDNFTILDDMSSKKMIKSIAMKSGKDYDRQELNDVKRKISHYKSNLIKPEKVVSDYCNNNKEDYLVASIYRDYQNQCWKERSFDFDDLIIYGILLISSYEDVQDWMHENIKYMMVDESQDTSTDQFQLIRLMVGNNNLMLFGDINQSIYKFRNARPEYLDSFCKMYPNSKLLKLSTNYRSTETIVKAANSVINNNGFGEKVIMKSVSGPGDLIGIKSNLYNEYEEARWIASEIKFLVGTQGKDYGDFAIVYRTNMQSNQLEKEFVNSGIPYTIIGSSSYWSSKQIRDILAYCKSVFNKNDVSSFERVLSSLPGVGAVTVNKIIDYMKENNLDAHITIKHIEENQPGLYRTSSKAKSNLNELQNMYSNLGKFTLCSQVAEHVVYNTTYADELKQSNSEEAAASLEIIQESINSFKQFELSDDSPESVIDQISLMSDAKGDAKKELHAVKMLSGHACKGLEFDTVFVAGAEEGLFPHWNAFKAEDVKDSIEEERRLFYVAITRAMTKLYITACENRRDVEVSQSRFLKEIPSILTEECF